MHMASRLRLGLTLPNLLGLTLAFAATGWTNTAAAITIKIDYSRDDAPGPNSKFFGSGNPAGAAAGAQARAALEAAAEFYSDALEDTFSAIEVPSKYLGSKGGQATFFWKRRYFDPSNGANYAEVNPEINANQYVIYVGAHDLAGNAVGLAGPGGYVGGFAARSGELTAQENAEITSIAAQFADESTDRGETSGFGRWGGSLAFDRPTQWHFDHTTSPPPNNTENDPTDDFQDFYSVALHEIAHVLGFGEVDEDDNQKTAWENLVDGTAFTGSNSLSAYTPTGNVPLASADDMSHWEQAIDMSPVYEEIGNQTPLMVPSIGPGIRRQLTNLDVAALADIGWEIDLPGGSASAATLASLNVSSGSASFAALSANIVPEPGSALLISSAASTLLILNSRRRFT